MAIATQQKPADSMLEKIEKAIADGIREAAEELFEKHKKQMIEELDRKKNEVVAGIMISLMGRVHIDQMGTNLTVTIESEALK